MKILLLFIIWQVLSKSCRNHEGNKVDWWLMLNVIGGNGLTYLYCDSISCDKFEYNKNLDINSSDSPLFKTVSKLDFTPNSESIVLNVVWNDQQAQYVESLSKSRMEGTRAPVKERNRKRTATPTPAPSIKKRAVDSSSLPTPTPAPVGDNIKEINPNGGAHSKGILSVSSKKGEGFIINHSLPRFPLIKDNKIQQELHHNAGRKAQHFFCATFPIDDIDKIAELYSLAELNIQKENGAKDSFKSYKHISPNFTPSDESKSDCKEKVDVQTIGHQEKFKIKVFAKSGECDQDIYEYISESLGTGLIIETWIIGRVSQNKDLVSKYKLEQNNKIQHNLPEGVKIEFQNSVDHSKYAISNDENLHYVCFADLNWVKTKSSRGGTALCFQHKKLWENIKQSFVSQDEDLDKSK